MRDLVAAQHANANAPAPQAPARNAPPRQDSFASVETYNSHRRIRRPRPGERRVYRPVRRHTLSRIDEAPPRPRSRSLQRSADFSSTRPRLRSRSNISADSSRSVPVCDLSHDIARPGSASPRYAEAGYESAESYERPASMTDLPIMVPVDAATGAYIPYPQYAYYRDDGSAVGRHARGAPRKQSKTNNLFLAFMY